MPAAPGATKAVGMVPDEMKSEPRSKGIATPRKKKPKADEDSTPFGRIAIDPILCIGCKKCLSKGPDGCFLDGCPWDAIAMVDTVEVEKEVGPMAI